jgi:hypothetical protein
MTTGPPEAGWLLDASPPSADLLRKFLEHRRATKTGG